jgi:hypothetical protein
VERTSDYKLLQYAVFIFAVIFVILGTYAKSFGDPANSRLATVYSLWKWNTWYIDRPLGEDPNPFEQRTIDKVVVKGEIRDNIMVGGRLISSKPPIMPLIMTGEYLMLNKVLGWSLDDRDDTNRCIRFMTMTIVGFSYLLALVFFAKTLTLFVDDERTRVVMLVALAFGTQLWGYSVNINNHVPGAGMMTVAMYFALGMATGKLAPTWWRFLLFGLTGGLVPTLDVPASIFIAICGLYLLVKQPKGTLTWTLLGAAIPLAVHFYIMVTVTGSPLPVQVRKPLYQYETSYWRHPRGIDALSEPKGTYLFHMTVGRCGLFSLYPILLLGFIAGIRALGDRALAHRKLILGGLAGFLIVTLYYAARTNNYGGEAFGFRWYIIAMPVLLLMAAPLVATFKARWQWIALVLMLCVSLFSAWQATVTPWGANREWTCKILGPSHVR